MTDNLTVINDYFYNLFYNISYNLYIIIDNN